MRLSALYFICVLPFKIMSQYISSQNIILNHCCSVLKGHMTQKLSLFFFKKNLFKQ